MKLKYITIGKKFLMKKKPINKQVVLIKNKKLKLINKKLTNPKNQEYTIKINYCGICSSDIYRSYYKWAYHYPLVMGHEISGTIVRCGKKTTQFKSGDRVAVYPLLPCKKCQYCKSNKFHLCINYKYYGSRNDGGYAEFINVKEWNLIKVPRNIHLQDAVFIEPVSVMVNALRKSEKVLKKKHNKKILILGAGFLGQILAEILKINFPKNKVFLFDKNLKKIRGKSLKKIKDITKVTESFDLIFELTGSPKMFENSINFCSKGGLVVWVGNITNNLILKKDLVSLILRKELTIKGVWNSSFFKKSSDDWNYALKIMQNGLRPSKFVTNFIKLEEVKNFLKKMYLHKMKIKKFYFIKIAIKT